MKYHIEKNTVQETLIIPLTEERNAQKNSLSFLKTKRLYA